ncbi:LysR substrate-binding domain-containing protein [Paenalcaligenes niemegkensis]|uniref:LysR substrate-binding domain-containing protein n=1 Tax=Paenalcaligenes niemegkensis TaxID=2895469 RepID=UPI001EE987D2|nr:LysR substrate-binding domain-containing protein [Paenalcaligenes niemegkensis]MCQ9615959.1 LysR substrate-binding domain-containing protein [Paenalcaligenes niemegkensis]
MISISIRHLETFVAIAATGTVKAAAATLFITQPAASMALAELERQVNTPLFDRLRGKMQLTSKGKELLPQAQEIIERLQALQHTALGNEALLRGDLRIGSSNTVGNYLIGDLLGDFVKNHPLVSLHVDVANTAMIIRRLLEHKSDVACVEGPVHHPELESRIWREDSLHVCAAADHPLALKPSLQSDDFAGVNWIMREHGSASRALTELAIAELPRGNILLELGQVEAIKQATIAGLGISCLPKAATLDAVTTGRLVLLHTPFLNLKRYLSLVVHQSRYQGKVLQAFLQQQGWNAQQ